MTLTLPEIAKKMADIDFCMLGTQNPDKGLAARPMSNNGDVEYDGDSYFFSYQDTAKVRDISRDPQVLLSFAGKPGLLGKPGMFISISGAASLIEDKSQFEAHWTKDLDIWFPQGVDTPGVVLIKVRAASVHYWDGEDEGEVRPFG